MAIVSVNGILYERVDTTENWESINPVLGNKEKGFERASDGTPIGWKMGNGATPWKLLRYWDTVTDEVVITIPAQPSFEYTLSPTELAAVNELDSIPSFIAIGPDRMYTDVYYEYTGSVGAFTQIVVKLNTDSSVTLVKFS